jgi:hypothetical protein
MPVHGDEVVLGLCTKFKRVILAWSTIINQWWWCDYKFYLLVDATCTFTVGILYVVPRYVVERNLAWLPYYHILHVKVATVE